MEVAFWLGLFFVVYPYVVYPGILIALNRLVRREPHVASSSFCPTVTVIVPAHNESAAIEAKIRNTLDADYPADRLSVVVVCDGCTDNTFERANALGAERVTAVALEKRSGKAAALNLGLEHAKSDIVVFTDVGTRIEPQALRRLVGHFADPEIVCVSGEDAIDGGGGEGLYARIEMRIRREEARLHSIAGASGCFYAQRRSHCVPFTPGMAPDFLSVLHAVSSGGRAISEPEARGHLGVSGSMSAEFRRKVRTFLRGITALFAHIHLLNPFRYGTFSFILASHKLARWLAPFPMILCLVAAGVQRESAFYAAAFYGQLVLYGAALGGMVFPILTRRIGLIRLTTFFLMVNIAALKAFTLWVLGVRRELWEPTRRP